MESTALHSLLILSDSALPLGSFAFSSGLESFLVHSKTKLTTASAKISAFDAFFTQSIHNVSSTSLPYVLTAYHNPSLLTSLDNDFDASTPCTVARRASVAQGKALLTIWERALSPSIFTQGGTETRTTIASITAFTQALKLNLRDPDFDLPLNGHFPSLFGAICRACSLSSHDTAYLFLLNHAKAVLSAAVRAGVMGPYQSQALLAGQALQRTIAACIKADAEVPAELAKVTVPTMDLWMGRHELLYSRIFNS